MRTGGRKPAFRSEHGRYYPLIAFYQKDKWQTKQVFDFFHPAGASFFLSIVQRRYAIVAA